MGNPLPRLLLWRKIPLIRLACIEASVTAFISVVVHTGVFSFYPEEGVF